MALIWTTAALCACILLSSVLAQSNICYEKADILFVMDASGSVGSSDFQKQLQFAATFINRFQVGVTQFSILRFDTTPAIVIDFDDFKDNTLLKNAILNVAYTGGGTNTAGALEMARLQAFTSARGARKGVPRITIVSTDGQSNNHNHTAAEAARLRDSNVLVLSIGVGRNYNKEELGSIATYHEDVFEVKDYDQLVSIVHGYSEIVCEEVKQFKCSNQADIIFLFDSSSTIPQSLYTNELVFASSVSANFDLKDVHIGAATFGGNTLQKLVALGQFSDQSQLAQVLQAAVYLGGSTDTDSALNSIISQNMFDTASGGRPDAAKILIILTDGGSISADHAKMTASKLRLTGVNIITAGVSKPNIAELQGLVAHTALDVVTNLANPKVAVERIQTLTAAQECTVPTKPIRDVSDYCREHLLENGIHAHPFDCTKFLECTYLKTDVMPCPPDQVWDNLIQTCNYPGFVKPDPCNIFNTPNMTRPPILVTLAPTTSKPCVKGLLDVLLILDSSDTVGSAVFGSILRDASNLPESFHLGAEALLFSALSFGTVTHSLFNFNNFTDYKPLQQAILHASYQGGASNTYLALEDALNIFSAGAGSRATVPKVAVVFSSGRSTDNQRTLQAAAALKAAGVHIISVGYSNPNLQQLQAIASTASEVFVNNNEGIRKAIVAYSNTTCSEGEIKCHGIQFSDVIFVLDSSASIAEADYQSQLRFVVDVTGKFTLGPQDARFAAVIFSQDPRKLFDLKEYTTQETIKSAIMSAEHLNSGTDTAKAINFVREQQMFSTVNGGRYNATKFVIILTDGRSNSINDTVNAALRLKTDGVKFIAVGIGNEIYLEEVQQLASDDKSLILVNNYTALAQIKDLLTKIVCEGSKDEVKVPEYSNLCSKYWWADGRHPNPDDCSTFVECKSFMTTVLSCPIREAYDPIMQKCTDKSAAHPCNDPHYFGPQMTTPSWVEVTSKSPTVVDISNICRDHNLADGIYPDPRLCNSFIDCTALLTQSQLCPSGLNFNTANNVCDDVHVVDCQVNYHYFDSP